MQDDCSRQTATWNGYWKHSTTLADAHFRLWCDITSAFMVIITYLSVTHGCRTHDLWEGRCCLWARQPGWCDWRWQPWSLRLWQWHSQPSGSSVPSCPLATSICIWPEADVLASSCLSEGRSWHHVIFELLLCCHLCRTWRSYMASVSLFVHLVMCVCACACSLPNTETW